jgi:outer membrane protein assembly factor BamB
MSHHIALILLASFLVSCSHLNTNVFSSVKGVRESKPLMTAAWIKNLDPEYDSGNLPISLQSPLIHEGVVYAGHNSGHMQAYELETGRLIWSEFDGSQFHSGAVVYKDQVVYGTLQGRVISRHGLMGTIKYSVDLGASIESRGVVAGGRILFHLRNHQIICLDVETGKILWGYKRSVQSLTTLQRVSTPLVYKNKVIVGFADGTVAGLSLEEGVLLYETKLSLSNKFVDVDNQPFIYDDKLFISPVQSILSILDPSTGKMLRQSDFNVSRAPFVNGEELLFGGINGEIIVTDKNLTTLRKQTVMQGAVTNIVSFKGQIAVTSTSGNIVVLDKKSLKVLGTYNLGHSYSAVFGEAISTGNEMAVMSSRNRLYLLK